VSGPLRRGSVVWATLDPTQGREQRGTRPALVIASDDYLSSVRGLVTVVPVTSVDRDWPHHVLIRGQRLGLARRSFAMTEQPRTVSIDRIGRQSGTADEATMSDVDGWLADFLGLR
jgi:mRNA interferase MazF